MFGPYQAFLFDNDGTLLISKPSVERAWTGWSDRQGLPARDVVDHLHGRRASDTIAHFLPGLSPEQQRQEIDWVETTEMEDTADIREVPGAGAFLGSLPVQRWAVATSATRRLALRRMEAAGLPFPSILVGAEDVEAGKPDPSGFLLAAKLLGVDPARCLIFEDTPSGIAAALAARPAGVAVVAAPGATTAPGVSFVIEDYRNLAVDVTARGLEIRRE